MPVDWGILWGRVVPGWLDVLGGGRSARQFYEEFVPLGYEDSEYIGLDDPCRAPDQYLSLFRRGRDESVLAAAVAGTPAYAEFAKAVDCIASTFLLSLAIKQTAAVDLPGTDAFADDLWLAHLSEPRIQVAGTKNLFPFLERAFEPEYRERAKDYCYIRKPHCDPAVQEPLELLFLYVRAIPGSWIHAPSSSWPATDDDSIAGYLNPREVQALSSAIAGWHGDGDEWNLFPLFKDRVTRSAANNLGLITLHAGLA